MTLRLGQEQEKAFTELKRWWSSPYKEPFILSGYAGTGKTTLAKIVAEDIVGDPEHVCFAAYTGKAALQLRKKGCDKATTLHKLLYRPLEKDRTRLLELSTYLQKLLVEDPQVEKPETIRVKTDLLSERRRVSTPSWENDPGVQAANMVDLDNDPAKLLEVIEIGKQLLITRGNITTFSIVNDVAKYFAIVPALFAGAIPGLKLLDIMSLGSPASAVLSAVIFNALVIPALIPLALRGSRYRPLGASALLTRNLLVYGLGGLLVPFVAIKLIDILITSLMTGGLNGLF